MQSYTEISSVSFDNYSKGYIYVEFAKIIRNGSNELARSIHRHVFFPGVSIDSELLPVNDSLVTEGYPEVSPSDVELIKATAFVQWTPERVAAYLEELNREP